MSQWMRNRWAVTLAAVTMAGTLSGSVLQSATASGTPRPGEFCAAADEGAKADYVTVSGIIDHMVCEASGNRHRWVTVSTSDSAPAPAPPKTKRAPKPPTPAKATTKVVAGPRGKTGPRGPKGAVGPRGYTGAVGAVGPRGYTGAVGAVGAVAAVGATGAIGVQGPAGPMGAAGAVGATGATGAAGTNGVSGYQVVTEQFPAGTQAGSVAVSCPAGKVALGGGGDMQVALQRSAPIMMGNLATGWQVSSGGADAGTVWVICANVG